jgi:ribosomal protein S18 acetylase RimI-like enzyme
MNASAVASSLTFRAARTDDLPRLVEIINDPPPPETLAIAGSVGGALTAAKLLARAGIGVNIGHTTVASVDGEVIGLVDAGSGAGGELELHPLTIARLLVPLASRVGPAAVVRGIRWLRINPRVQFPLDPAAWHINELDVAAVHRGQGVGRALLGVTERDARAARAPRLTLTTKIDNPARRLYERFGFVVTGEKRDAEWTRWAQSPGRISMAKDFG